MLDKENTDLTIEAIKLVELLSSLIKGKLINLM